MLPSTTQQIAARLYAARSRVLIVAATAAFLGTTIGAMGQVQQPYGTDLPYVQTQNQEWMRALPDDTKITRLTIPGTHETLSFHGGNGVRTNSMWLEAQLNAGIRLIDIRGRLPASGAAIEIWHGIIYQHATFDDVLRACQSFLEANPSETIFLRLQQTEDSLPRFWERFEQYKKEYSSVFWQAPGHAYVEIPSLGEVRGKIVLFQEPRIALPVDWQWSGFDFRNSSALFETNGIHGEFAWWCETEVITHNKWNSVAGHLDAADTNGESQFYVAGLTGSLWIAPRHAAMGTSCLPFGHIIPLRLTGLNEELLNRLTNSPPAYRLGMIMLDFPGADLIDAIIGVNFLNDTDRDGVFDALDAEPENKFRCRDTDSDGCDDCASGFDDPENDGRKDTDGDGICDLGDNCTYVWNPDQDDKDWIGTARMCR